MATKKNTPNKKTNNRSGFFFMFIILILLGVIVFAYRDKFTVLAQSGISYSKKITENKSNNSKNNGIKEKIGKIEQDIKKKISKQKPANTNKPEQKEIFTKTTTTISNKVSIKPIQPKKQVVEAKQKTEIKKDQKTVIEKKVAQDRKTTPKIVEKSDNVEEKNKIEQKKVTTPTKVERKPQNDIKSRTSKVYFTKINEEHLSLTSVNRAVDYYNTPLTETIKKLLAGPSKNEQINDIVSNIPGETKLLSIWVKEGVAYLNFSSEFEDNYYGRESTVLQLKQVIYTVTEFNNIKSVQILINGKNQNYLGGEGIFIGKPLSRADFS